MTQYRQNLAACFIFLRRYEDAEKILNDISREFPKFPLVNFHLGLVAEEKDDLALAENSYRKEIECYPRSVPARFNLGKLCLKNGDFGGYMEQMNEIVKLEPEMAEGRLFLARGQLRDPAADLAAVEVNVEIGLKNTRAPDLLALGWFLMADIYSRRQLPARVSEALRKANHYKALQGKTT